MILLLGGTTEAAPIATALCEAGFKVLLSTATAMPASAPLPPEVERQTGALDRQGLIHLIREQEIRAVVDATHPYAEAVSANAYQACLATDLPYFAFERPSSLPNISGILWGANHAEAASLAFSFGHPVLLTIGVRNLSQYVAIARSRNIPFTARVLDHASSREACRRLGLTPAESLCANGPFSVEENIAHIIRHRIGVLVTKDSGDAGGVHTKITAAKASNCRIVAISRPARPTTGYSSIEDIAREIATQIRP